jgi:hypothetical protein
LNEGGIKERLVLTQEAHDEISQDYYSECDNHPEMLPASF